MTMWDGHSSKCVDIHSPLHHARLETYAEQITGNARDSDRERPIIYQREHTLHGNDTFPSNFVTLRRPDDVPSRNSEIAVGCVNTILQGCLQAICHVLHVRGREREGVNTATVTDRLLANTLQGILNSAMHDRHIP